MSPLSNFCNPSQAWSILQRHATETDFVSLLKLQELCQDEDRVTSMVAVHNSSVDLEDGASGGRGHLLLVDYSRQRMTTETIHHLLRLATAREIRESIRDLAWGRLAPGAVISATDRRQRRRRGNHFGEEYDGLAPSVSFANDDGIERSKSTSGKEEGGSMHLALRAPANKGLAMRCPYEVPPPPPTKSGRNARNVQSSLPAQKAQKHGTTAPNANHHHYFSHTNPKPANLNNKPTGAPSNSSSSFKYTNALAEIHQEWKRISSVSDSFRKGKLRGATGLPLCDVLLVAVGGTVVPTALEFVYRALEGQEEAGRALMVDSNLVSLTESSAGASGSGSKPSDSIGGPLASSFQSTAGGVIHMVTTPFKTSRSKSSHDLFSGGNLYNYTVPPSSSPPQRKRKLKFITSIDPAALTDAMSDLSPANTIVISLALDLERENESKQVTLAVRSWLLSGMIADGSGGGVVSGSGASGVTNIDNSVHKGARTDAVVKMHMFLVTGKESLKKSNPDNVFLVPRHSRCEAFSTFSAAGLLPISLLFGWDIASSIVNGAHDLDRHFVDTNPRHNLPVMLALADVWNDAFLRTQGRILSPFSEAFGSYPSFVAAIEDKVLNADGKGGPLSSAPDRFSRSRRSLGHGRHITGGAPSPVLDGGHHRIYDHWLNQGSKALCSEFITALDPHSSSLSMGRGLSSGGGGSMEDIILTNHDNRICSMFAHADTLAFGDGGISNNARGRSNGASHGMDNDIHGGRYSPESPPAIQTVDSMQSILSTNEFGSGFGIEATTMGGNRSSTIIICGTCDAFACGQLVALAEHRALVKAWLWGIDPFAAPKSPAIRKERTEYLKERLDNLYNLISLGEDIEGEEDSSHKDDGPGGKGIGGLNLATRTILKHYANRMQKYKPHVVKTPIKAGHNRFSEDNYY